MSNPVSSYLQLATPTDAYVPNEDPRQLVDLDEVYDDTDQDKITMMVKGTESLSLGVLSREIATKFNLPNAREFDPFPSKRNAVIGAEGFFTTMYEGFKTFVENIIKYIRMAFDWVANTVKGIFGFRKSERIEKAIDDSLDSLKGELKNTLTSLGFPAAQYNLENFIGNLPGKVDRIGQLTLMKTKFESDKEAIEGLTKSIPMFQQVVGKLTQASSKANRLLDNYRKVLKDQYDRTRVRSALQQHVPGEFSPEVQKLSAANREAILAMDPMNVVKDVGELLATLYKVEFTNDELTNGFSKVRKDLETAIKAESIKLTQFNAGEMMNKIQELNLRYVELADNTIDMRGINMKALGQAVDKTDADRAQALAGYYGVPDPIVEYQELAITIRNYANFCQVVSRQLLAVDRQINELSRWYARAHMWFLHGLIGDMDKLRALMLEARQEGKNPQADIAGNPTFHLEMIPEADAKTFMENFGASSRQMFEENIADMKTRYNNLVKQLGVGKTL